MESNYAKSANIKIAKLDSTNINEIAYLRFSARMKELILEMKLNERKTLYGEQLYKIVNDQIEATPRMESRTKIRGDQ